MKMQEINDTINDFRKTEKAGCPKRNNYERHQLCKVLDENSRRNGAMYVDTPMPSTELQGTTSPPIAKTHDPPAGNTEMEAVFVDTHKPSRELQESTSPTIAKTQDPRAGNTEMEAVFVDTPKPCTELQEST